MLTHNLIIKVTYLKYILYICVLNLSDKKLEERYNWVNNYVVTTIE